MSKVDGLKMKVQVASIDVTLRDWFAGQAMAGAMANERLLDSCIQTESRLGKRAGQVIAEYCGVIADAMLAEREGGAP